MYELLDSSASWWSYIKLSEVGLLDEVDLLHKVGLLDEVGVLDEVGPPG